MSTNGTPTTTDTADRWLNARHRARWALGGSRRSPTPSSPTSVAAAEAGAQVGDRFGAGEGGMEWEYLLVDATRA